MASLEEKKAMMATVPIDPVARMILDLPGHVETYADLDEWKAQHGRKISRTQGAAFRAAFDTHCEEHESMLKTSRDFGRLGNHAVISPSHTGEDRAPRKKQATSQDTAFENNRATTQRQLVNAWGEPVTDDGLANNEWASNGASSYKSSGKSHPYATSNVSSQRHRGPEPDTFKKKSRKASGPSSATQESFLRQRALIDRNSVQTSQIQSHYHPDAQDGPSRPNERVQDMRARPEYNLDARGARDTAHHGTAGSFAREADVYGVARDENDAKMSAAQTEKKAAGTTADQSWNFSGEEQANTDVDW